MTKYINLLCCSAMAIAVASPVSAGIVNLYELKNFLYFGSTNLGAPSESPSCGLGEVAEKPDPNMNCNQRTVSKGDVSITCYSNCSCNTSVYKYDDSNCPSAQKFVLGGDVCGGKYNSCGCSDGSLTLDEARILSSYFTGLHRYTGGVEGEVVCNYVDTPGCYRGTAVEYNSYSSATIGEYSRENFMYRLYYKQEPLVYMVMASSKNINDSKTSFCVMDVDIRPELSRAAFKYDRPGYNYECGKVSEIKSAMLSRSLQDPNDGQYRYFTGDKTDKCVAENKSGYGSEEVYWFDPGEGVQRSTTYYKPTCVTTLKQLSMATEEARTTYGNLSAVNVTSTEYSSGNSCVIFGEEGNECKEGYNYFADMGILFSQEDMSNYTSRFGSVDNFVSNNLSRRIPDKTFELETTTITYPDDFETNGGKTSIIACYKETGCKVPENASIACTVDSNLITALNNGLDGYNAPASDACDGIKIIHPIDERAFACIPTTCTLLQDKTYGEVLSTLGKASSTYSDLSADVQNAFCPYGLCSKEEVYSASLQPGGLVVGSDGIGNSASSSFPVTMTGTQPTSSTHIYFKCKEPMPLIDATPLSYCAVGDYLNIPSATCSSNPQDSAKNLVIYVDDDYVYYDPALGLLDRKKSTAEKKKTSEIESYIASSDSDCRVLSAEQIERHIDDLKNAGAGNMTLFTKSSADTVVFTRYESGGTYLNPYSGLSNYSAYNFGYFCAEKMPKK